MWYLGPWLDLLYIYLRFESHCIFWMMKGSPQRKENIIGDFKVVLGFWLELNWDIFICMYLRPPETLIRSVRSHSFFITLLSITALQLIKLILHHLDKGEHHPWSYYSTISTYLSLCVFSCRFYRMPWWLITTRYCVFLGQSHQLNL